MGLKRPWNIVDMPVYSLATYVEGRVNMNICTYVSAVSMKPKLFMLAVDYTTQTYENLNHTNKAVLQILHQDQASLVRMLGKQSGKTVNKQEKLQKRELLTTWKGHTVLKDACGYLELFVNDRKNIGGDHEIFYCEVTSSRTQTDQGILMFQDLIAKGLIL